MRAVSNMFLFLRIFVFAAAVPYLMRLKVVRLAAVLERGSDPWPVNPNHIRKIDAYVEAAIELGKPLVRPGCLTLGLTRYYFFRRAGMDVSLHFGMGRIGGGSKYLGHCWLVRDGEPYLETRDPRRVYTEMYRISRKIAQQSLQTKAMGVGRLINL